MTIALIEAALEERLQAITPAIDTAFENKTFTPVAGTEYQRINHLTNTPVDHAVTLDVTEDRGILQVSLFFPLDKGRVPAKTRAQLIRDQFKPPLTLTKGAVKVEITKTPSIGSGYPEGDRYMVPVSIYWQSFKAT